MSVTKQTSDTPGRPPASTSPQLEEQGDVHHVGKDEYWVDRTPPWHPLQSSPSSKEMEFPNGKGNLRLLVWVGGYFLIFFWWQSGDSHAISRQSNCRQLSHFAICRQSKYRLSIYRLSTFLPPLFIQSRCWWQWGEFLKPKDESRWEKFLWGASAAILVMDAQHAK